MELTAISPHDLLVIRAGSFRFEAQVPDWVLPLLSKTLTVVVRRGELSSEYIPVGLRGHERNQRFGGFVTLKDINKQYTPSMLSQADYLQQLTDKRQSLPVFQTLAKLQKELTITNWGPGGSCGFELATGLPVVKKSSDLDLIWHPDQKISPEQAKQMVAYFDTFSTAIDMQVITNLGGFAIREYATAKTILLKTNHGPELSSDPWGEQ